jgi:ABC-2 type transport system ATP-binding protein
MSIIIENISKVYGQQLAVNDININIPKGQIVGFLGPNGAGKSTTMKMITGYLAATKGSIAVCGKDVSTNHLEIRKLIGYLPESNPQYYDMYVREYLGFLAKLHKLGANSNSRIEEMINTTGLQHEAHKKIGQLSKGYKQRVGLAQAMLHNPQVLILDEPTSGLDPNQIVEIRNLITTLGQEKTVMLSTHIMQEVNAMCQRAIIINKGKIVADSQIEELKNSLNKDKQVLEISFAQAIDTSLLKNIPSVLNIKNTLANTYNIEVNNTSIARKAILQTCLDNNIDIISINEAAASLEEVFRQLTLPTE